MITELSDLNDQEKRHLLRRLLERRAWLLRCYSEANASAHLHGNAPIAERLFRDAAFFHWAIVELDGLREELGRMIEQ